MRLVDTFSIAGRGLGRHWTRAMLNVTGIFAGVASVVLLIALAHSVSAASKANVEGLGTNVVVVYSAGASSSGVQAGIATTSSLTTTDVAQLGNPGYVPEGRAAVPTSGVRAAVAGPSTSAQTDVLGSTELFAAVRGYSVAAGRFIDTADNAVNSGGANVIVLGATVAKELFPGQNPLGRNVTISQHTLNVIGVFAPRGSSGTFNQDDLAVMPIETLWTSLLPSPKIQQVLIQASTPNTTAQVKAEATNLLLHNHHITDPGQADFQVQTQQDLLASAERLGTVMKWMLAVIASISLLTGAIGIMSMMLASVRERGYEIGIRRAVGATWGNILSQFLVEALLLACIGGVVGIALGIGGAQVMGNVVTDLPAPVVTYTAVLIAGAVALVIGVGAGLYPAARAAALQPAEAVRRR
jgi:putative ABC transport system permease protein